MRAEASSSEHHSCVLGGHLADRDSISSEFVAPHRVDHQFSIIGCHDCNEATFVGDVNRVKSEKPTRRVNLGRNWHRCFVVSNAHVPDVRKLTKSSGETTAGEVAHDMHIWARVENGIDQTVQRSTIGLELSSEFESFAHAEDGGP